MAVLDNLIRAMKLNDDEDYYDDEQEYGQVYEDEIPVKKRFRFGKTGTDDIDEDLMNDVESGSSRFSSASSKITPMRTRKNATMEVCVIKPKAFDDAKEIAETLLTNRTVILNIEGLDYALAQRLIDFISGASYAINGNLQRVSAWIFVITPHAVDISGDLQDIADAFGVNGM